MEKKRKEKKRAGLTNTTDKTQRHRQEDKRMHGRKPNQRNPDAKVVNLKDLAARKRQHDDAEQLRERDATEDAGADVDECGPGAAVLVGRR